MQSRIYDLFICPPNIILNIFRLLGIPYSWFYLILSVGEELKFTIDGETPFGSRLEIQLPTECADEFKMLITYKTTAKCEALLWMSPEQTSGGVHPFVFSQCEAIQARAMLPCQDTPSIKVTYSASVTAPAGVTVLMSAVRKEENQPTGDNKMKFSFEQKIPIVSYLIAIAAGDLKSRKIGPRSHVWAEEKYLETAAFDFSDTEKMLATAEELCGPYVWGIYDILVLPPSFPFGGMENPCLTFVTPTLLSGDKSNATVVAHEISHSWTGNLVTNVNFEHFWLNEGFTKFTEYKIAGRLKGEAARHLQAIRDWPSLVECVNKEFGADHPLTKLVPNLEGVDPEDAFSDVPYLKGQAFLWFLETKVGGPTKMEPFLRSYYEKFKFQSISTDVFKAYFLEYFADCEEVKDIDWNTWLYAPGMPPVKPDFDQTLVIPVYDLADRWRKWSDDTSADCPFHQDDLKSFMSEQVTEFLNNLMVGDPLSLKAVEKLTEVYKFNESPNKEILFRWIRLGLGVHYEASVQPAVDLVTEVGRGKYVIPIYRDLWKWEEKKQLALDTFEATRAKLMSMTREGVAKELGLKPKV